MELKERLKAKTPLWFRRIRKAGIYLSAVCLALIAANDTIPGFHLPEILNEICQWGAAASIAASAVAATAKEDAPSTSSGGQ